MKPSRKTLLYAAYIIGVTLFFLWYLFPSETLKDYLAYRLSRGNPNVRVAIDRISPVLPPGIKLHRVDVSRQNMALIELESLKLMPGLGSIFKDTNTINFNARMYEGQLSGRAEIGTGAETQGLKIDGTIAGVQVQNIAALQVLSGHDISGSLGGNFVLAVDEAEPEISGNFSLNNCRLDLAAAVFNLDFLEFKLVNADLALQNRNLVIKKFSATGSQLDLKLAGRINLNPRNMAGNEMNLTGTVTPHHVFLAKIEMDLPENFLRQKKSGQTTIPFKISGTMEDPDLSLN